MKNRAAAEAGSATERRHSDKMTKYFRDCEREGIQFFPIVQSHREGGGGDYKVSVPEAESSADKGECSFDPEQNSFPFGSRS